MTKSRHETHDRQRKRLHGCGPRSTWAGIARRARGTISPILDAVRLARTAARLRASGFHVPAIVYRGSHRPWTSGFAALQPQELSSFVPPDAGGSSGRAAVASPLDATTGSELIAGNRIEVELDNPKARNWLLHAIESSEDRVHFQVYMALDDDVGRPVEAALAAAAARGVTVRVLVDSLHGLHGSFGLHNAILDRLSSRPGVELRVGNPITGESSPRRPRPYNGRQPDTAA